MQEYNSSFAKPGHLADYLAELENQLRLSDTSPSIRKHDATLPGWSPVKVRLAAELVGLVGEEAGQAGLQRLGTVIPALLSRLESRTNRLEQLAAPLGELESLLTDVLGRLDAGTPLADILADRRWDGVLAGFHTAGSALSVLSQVDGCLHHWQDRWGNETLAPLTERELSVGWKALRSFGDALFGGAELPGAEIVEPGESGDPVALILVDSPFRRDQLSQKLTVMPFSPEIMTDPEELVARLYQGRGPVVVLCDNLEPNNNLARVADRLDGYPLDRRPPLVLITGGSREPSRENMRARALGGAGAWVEPFVADHLSELLAP